MVVCKCLFLDGKEVNVTVDRNATGSDLFESVCKYLNIHDRGPLWLVHRGGSKPTTYNWWVRPDKPLRKQITGKCQVWAFALVVKFYPVSNFSGFEDITRFYMVLQVREDLLTGRLTCSSQTMAILASYWLQSEYGEYKSENIDRQLVEAFHYVRKGGKSRKGSKSPRDIDIDFEDQMIELHRDLGSLSATHADIRFLKLASSLDTYGMHFYPAYELPPGSKYESAKSTPSGKTVMFGLGASAIRIESENTKKDVSWSNIRAVSFQHNSVMLKFHAKKIPNQIFIFEDMNQSKTVWRTAIDFHLHYRLDKRDQSPVNFKLKRKWSVLGKKEAKMKSAPSASRKSKLPVITENSPASLRRSRVSLPRGSDETKPKEILAQKADPTNPKRFPSLPLKTPRSPSQRSYSSRRTTSSQPASKKNSPSSSPTLDERKERGKAPSHTSSPSSQRRVNGKPSPALTARFDETIASSVPTRLRSGYATSQTSTAAEEILSNVTDNTDVLCSDNIMEKAFSYAESGGVNAINSWLELCTPRGSYERRGRPVSRSAPASQRSRSRGRSPGTDIEADDINDYKPLIKSKHPIVIRAKNLRDLSPPLTVHYEDEPVRRTPARYKSADNVAKKDWTIRREPYHAFDPPARRFADIYRQEYLDNVTVDPYRRARSMYSLASKGTRVDRSPPSDHRRSVSPSTVSAHASSGSRRSFGSYLGTSYDDDLYGRAYDLPSESSFNRRVLSESRLAKTNRQLDDIHAAQARQRRQNVNSWALGDSQELDFREMADCSTSQVHRYYDNSIPSIPKFVRSVR
ncbi:unnamed protein product [Clavelina lepadiformis]|uniref:FERM domain-containing protein n=1 Tax=Clavelina lepadiformis TaxID=159417 RepID=A0ABP0F3X5_CLALP